MIIDTFANRLQKALDKNRMKPIELAKKTGLDKSLISNYLSGKYKAKQDKLTLISKVLHVNEIWLMGYDVPDDYSYEGVIHDDETNTFCFRFNPENNNLPSDNLMEHYKELFNNDDALTESEKKFILDFIEDKHEKKYNNNSI